MIVMHCAETPARFLTALDRRIHDRAIDPNVHPLQSIGGHTPQI
jgi:hypothetical protein